jgi:hypothetical protein
MWSACATPPARSRSTAASTSAGASSRSRAWNSHDHPQVVTRIDVGVAVAGEVLEAAGHALAQRAAHPCACEAGHVARTFAEAALGDHRGGQAVVDVQQG